MEKKITKKEMYNALIAQAKGETPEVEVTATDIIDFCTKEIDALDRKAEKARENAAKKRAEGDALTELVAAVLTDEAATIAQIAAAIDHEDATPSKVGYRLRVLAETGRAVKEEVTVAGGEGSKSRKLVAYKIAQ